jgi:hypothetical protein
MNDVTGGTVEVTVEGESTVELDMNSGVPGFDVPIGKWILIRSSSGQWRKIFNAGSTIEVTGGGGSDDAEGPALVDPEE